MKTERRLVDNRVFLLGLDELYRESMKTHERKGLLRCAQATAKRLSVAPMEVPVEGYYSEGEALTRYFRLVRALQQVPKARESEVADMDGYQRLKQVTASPLFGLPNEGAFLLAGGRDALTVALDKTWPVWHIDNLTNTAYQCALESDDFSLVALAALARDAVVLAALRESVVLYAAVGVTGCPPEPEYVWQVDAVIQARAQRFVATFNALFDESLPQPQAANAAAFWRAAKEWKLVGRCVRLGCDDSVWPIKHYHWAVERDAEAKLIVNAFWDTELWTTERYRQQMSSQTGQ